jgi:transglutaminase-like putative cysteine protease
LRLCHLFAGLLLFSMTPAAVLASSAQSHSDQIASVQQQYLAAKNSEQRKQFVGELKALTKDPSAADAVALNAAVSAMLPAADSTWEAEQLLAIGASINPAEQLAGAPDMPQDTEFLVDPRRASQQALHASGDVETLADIRIDHLQQDSQGRQGLASAHIQQVWRINDAQGTRSFSPYTVMYSGMTETLVMVRARVLKSDGREMDAAVSADQPVVKRGAAMYFDARKRALRFSRLDAGDLVEIEYRLLPTVGANESTGYYARFDQFRDTFATRLWRRVLTAPSSMKLYAVERGLGPAVVRDNGAETTQTWEAREIGAQAPEAASAGTGANARYLHVSTIGSVQEFGRWYNERLGPALELDENLIKVAQQIQERNLTTKAKVQAVYETVKRSTKYTGFEFGVHSFQPYPVSMVERRGFGDCKDKAAMLVALLRAVGVQAEFAMVRTRAAGAVADDAYSVEVFDHAMAFIPELNIYLDGTANSVQAGELPANDLGAMAMTVDAEGNATRRTVPLSASQGSSETQTAQMHPVGKSDVELAPRTKLEAGVVANQQGSSPSISLPGND